MGIKFEPPFSVKQTEGLTWSKEGFGWVQSEIMPNNLTRTKQK